MQNQNDLPLFAPSRQGDFIAMVDGGNEPVILRVSAIVGMVIPAEGSPMRGSAFMLRGGRAIQMHPSVTREDVLRLLGEKDAKRFIRFTHLPPCVAGASEVFVSPSDVVCIDYMRDTENKKLLPQMGIGGRGSALHDVSLEEVLAKLSFPAFSLPVPSFPEDAEGEEGENPFAALLRALQQG